MVKKNQKWDWMEKQEKLTTLDLDKKIRMEVDVSDYEIGEVLSMECKNRQQRLIAYLSKSLNQTNKNYEIYDKEILVVIRRLENQIYLSEGTKFKFEV